MKLNDYNKGILCDFNNRSNLLVSFGGIKQGIGVPMFEFFNSLKDLDCDKIYLRDFEQAWYFKGVDQEISNFHELIEYLKYIINKNNYRNVCFLGNSMGGFGALLFGSLLNVNKIIAFSPQTFIDFNNKLRFFDYRWISQIFKIYLQRNKDSLYFDLLSIFQLNSFESNVHIYYSIQHRLDSLHSERLVVFNNVNLHPVEKKGHSIVKYLRDTGDLKIILSSIF